MIKDIIYREDAIKAINLRARIPHDIASAHYASMAINAIRSVSSADRPSAVDLSSVYSTAYKSGYEKGKAGRPQGEWITCWDEMGENEDGYKCTKCSGIAEEKFAYCPNCGARMEGADDEID